MLFILKNRKNKVYLISDLGKFARFIGLGFKLLCPKK